MAGKHTWDIPDLKKLHVPKEGASNRDTENGACLTRHGKTRSNQKLVESSCNHAWQGWKKAQQASESGRYNWPKYRGLARAKGEDKRLTLMDRGGKLRTRMAPCENEWDLTAGRNFHRDTNTPYWNEAHHIVPNSVLELAVEESVADSDTPIEHKQLIGGGLLEAKYNLNHMENVILLPGQDRVAVHLSLLRHLETERHRDHVPYRMYVLAKVKDKLKATVKKLQAHPRQEPSYTSLARKIVSVSQDVRGEIKAYGVKHAGDSLDQHFKPEEAQAAPRSMKSGGRPG